MENFKLPEKYLAEKISENKSRFTIEPLNPGYGITIGNALRRVLLSSIEGAAIVAIKIKGADHEFSTLPGVKEDLVDILLNLKKIRLNVHSDEILKLKISVSGEKKVKAGDIEKDAQAEIINKNQEIATLTSKDAKFEADIFVSKGRGYLPVEAREGEKLEVGTIAVDAIFTPIKLVNFKTENVRVGQMTNWNKLILEVETDGTMTPEETVKKAANILVDHFNLILSPEEEKSGLIETVKEKTNKKEEAVPEEEEKNEKSQKKRGRPKKNP